MTNDIFVGNNVRVSVNPEVVEQPAITTQDIFQLLILLLFLLSVSRKMSNR